MSYDGNGNYTVPAGTTAVTGTVIDSADYNALLADLQTALTKALLRDGQSAALANLPMGGYKLTGLAAGSNANDSVRFDQLTAGSIVNTPAGSIAATTVQAALNELDTEKAAAGANNDITSLAALASVPSVVTTAIAAAVPAGTLIDFAGTAAPSGYLACPITATNISRTTYATLFAAIGTTWGSGDGSTTFGCPWFPENYAALQANANVGTATTGEVKSHLHAMNADGANVAKRYGADGPIDGSSSTSSAEDAHYNGSQNTGNTGGTANLAAGHRVLKCVKL